MSNRIAQSELSISGVVAPRHDTASEPSFASGVILHSGKFVFLGLPPEDYDKRERVVAVGSTVLSGDMEQIIPGMMGIISGAIEHGVDIDCTATLVREAQEEYGVGLSAARMRNGLPQCVVEQTRGGMFRTGTAATHVVEISDWQRLQLTAVAPMELVAFEALHVFLHESPQRLRPFVHGLIAVLLQEGWIYHIQTH